MTLQRRFTIAGSDGNTYTVQEHARPGPNHRPLSGPHRSYDGPVEYLLADGRDLLDDKPGYWEILGSGVLLKKPTDL